MHNIFIADKSFTFDWLTNPENTGAQSVLRRAKEAGEHPECGCGSARPRMYIAKRTLSGVYYLARMPSTASMHQPSCLLSRETESSSSSGHATEAITKNEDGISISLDGSLSQRTTAGEVSDSSVTKSRVSNNTVTLLGLLEFLWDEARFNYWYPNIKYPRQWGTVKRAFERLAAENNIKISNKLLSSILYMPTQFNKAKASHHATLNKAELTLVTKSENDGFIAIGELKELKDANHSTFIKLKHADKDTCFWMHKGLADKFKKCFSAELGQLDNLNKKVIVILIGFKKNKSLSVSALALMRVSKEYIPVDSSYEDEVVQKLVLEKRKFRKPLKYDAANEVLPDFQLLDCEVDSIPLEVFGMKGNMEYDLRKAEKVQIYNKSYGQYGWWSWNAADNLVMPSFPKKK